MLAAQDADALLILNDWQEFAELDLAKLHYTLRYPIVIDGRNLYDPAMMTKRGFTYLSVGRPGLSQPIDPVAAFFLPRPGMARRSKRNSLAALRYSNSPRGTQAHFEPGELQY